jgi:hypothetical protein
VATLRAIYICGWLAFWLSLPINLYAIQSEAALAVWCGAALICDTGAVFYLGIGRWWWHRADRLRNRRWFRGYILGAACQLGLLTLLAAYAAEPDSYLGIKLLLAATAGIIAIGGARNFVLRLRAPTAS